MNEQLLSVGYQHFPELRDAGAVYIDKSALISRLVTRNKAVFLSRPRRFGKSLLVSTIDALFSGRADLFRGLAVEESWDFSVTHPVVRLSFGAGDFIAPDGLEEALSGRLAEAEIRHGLPAGGGRGWQRLESLLSALGRRGPAPVLLIDEYDKPIVQLMERGLPAERLEHARHALQTVYSSLKDAPLRFLLLTGVGRVAKTGVFSGLNHLKDITWDEAYATLLGITAPELESALGPSLAALAERRGLSIADCVARFTAEYNGFCFSPGAPRVFNPFSALLALDQRSFGSYWVQSGTPEFLVRAMAARGLGLAEVSGAEVAPEELESLDLAAPSPLSLLLQTGYLTIVHGDERTFRLDFPNEEVRRGFVRHFIQQESAQTEVTSRALTLLSALSSGDLGGVVACLQGIFGAIPYGLDDATEKRYHSLVHGLFLLAVSPRGVVLSEVQSALGRTDVVVELPEITWVFELKRDRPAKVGLAQAIARQYADPWRGRLLPSGDKKPVRTIALTFGTEARNIVAWAEAPHFPAAVDGTREPDRTIQGA